MTNMYIVEPYTTTVYFDVVVVQLGAKVFAGPIQLNESLKSRSGLARGIPSSSLSTESRHREQSFLPRSILGSVQ